MELDSVEVAEQPMNSFDEFGFRPSNAPARGWLIRHGRTAVVVALAVTMQSCTRPCPMPRPDRGDKGFQDALAEQKRINRYFHDAVVPNLERCWGRVHGTGTVEIRYEFSKSTTGKWEFKDLELGRTDLPRGEDAVAAQCMQEAVAGTWFPVDEHDEGEAFLIDWTWPVPLPADVKQQADEMFKDNGGGGTGCDGDGTAAKCFKCKSATACLTVCVGYKTCELVSNPKETSCTATHRCASGGPFGVIGGGAILY